MACRLTGLGGQGFCVSLQCLGTDYIQRTVSASSAFFLPASTLRFIVPEERKAARKQAEIKTDPTQPCCRGTKPGQQHAGKPNRPAPGLWMPGTEHRAPGTRHRLPRDRRCSRESQRAGKTSAVQKQWHHLPRYESNRLGAAAKPEPLERGMNQRDYYYSFFFFSQGAKKGNSFPAAFVTVKTRTATASEPFSPYVYTRLQRYLFPS